MVLNESPRFFISPLEDCCSPSFVFPLSCDGDMTFASPCHIGEEITLRFSLSPACPPRIQKSDYRTADPTLSRSRKQKETKESVKDVKSGVVCGSSPVTVVDDKEATKGDSTVHDLPCQPRPDRATRGKRTQGERERRKGRKKHGQTAAGQKTFLVNESVVHISSCPPVFLKLIVFPTVVESTNIR